MGSQPRAPGLQKGLFVMSEFLWYLQRWYFSLRRCLALLIFIIVGWDFLVLIGPGRLIKETVAGEFRSAFPFNLFVKEDPAKIQAHCYHLYERNSLKNFFCPLCGKRLLQIYERTL